jgi:hypothetical protein
LAITVLILSIQFLNENVNTNQGMLLIDFMMLEKELKDLMMLLGSRGFMTILGFRKTTGS